MELGVVQLVDINEEMRVAYLDYAMSVIVARALPDARDGLKPVQRRILYAMHDLHLNPDGPYKKSARIVGEVLGKYHPHGDQAVYEAMVRMAQDFSLRYPLVAGQGNFGSIDGDNAAAMRYTEARLSKIGADMMTDIAKDTVDFLDNFDGSLQEPAVLPASFPNLLVNGASGIAVGMSTSVPPHNLGEVCDALIFMLQKWEKLDDVGVPDLMQFIKGPDFPTGGVIYRTTNGEGGAEEDGLVQAYATGKGRITVRAKAHIEEWTRGRSRIVVSEIPYQVSKNHLIERVAELAREGRLEGLTEMRDESDRHGLRIVMEVSRTAEPAKVLNDLFRLTPLQSTFSIILLALVDGEPRTLTLKQALRVYLDHRLEVVRRRSEHDLAQAKARAHILEGLLKALDNLDAVIDTIRRSRTVETARDNLIKKFKLTEIQAQAILEMQLRRLAALERQKLQEEYKEKVKLIKDLERLLRSPKLMRQAIIEELTHVKATYADPRRTAIAGGPATSAAATSLMPDEDVWVTLTASGKLSRTFTDEQPKVTTEMKDPPRALLASNTLYTLYLFAADGQAASVPVHQLPQAEDPAEGADVFSLLPLKKEQEIVAALSLPPGLETGYLFLTTRDGNVKRVRIEDTPGASAHAFTVMNVGKEDRLGWVRHTTGEDEVILATAEAQAIRFKEAEVRPTGLPAGGMRGIKLMGQRDRVVGMDVVNPRGHFWSITETGLAKLTPMGEFPTQGRAGGGVVAMKLSRTSGSMAAAMVGRADDRVIVVTDKGRPKLMRLGTAAKKKRGTVGESVIALQSREHVAGIVVPQGRMAAPQAEGKA